MLEYCKKILRKVSFDLSLFRKELKKSRKLLKREEEERLRLWALERFGPPYRRTVHEVFQGSEER